jgi:hypothetical protein
MSRNSIGLEVDHQGVRLVRCRLRCGRPSNAPGSSGGRANAVSSTTISPRIDSSPLARNACTKLHHRSKSHVGVAAALQNQISVRARRRATRRGSALGCARCRRDRATSRAGERRHEFDGGGGAAGSVSPLWLASTPAGFGIDDGEADGALGEAAPRRWCAQPVPAPGLPHPTANERGATLPSRAPHETSARAASAAAGSSVREQSARPVARARALNAAPPAATRRSASADSASSSEAADVDERGEPAADTSRSRNCGSQSTQPAPGLNVSEWASGTNSDHDSASTMSDGMRTSPAPRRHAPLEMLKPVEQLIPGGDP